ncbi:hypothetical protein FHS27_002005 [Rhodopirellula rubra]|uniref:Uncharacterized protein n=1 Tax=Aporhodopirellula rubra TaxID=980271 RepID=A0A7W5H4B3_9BACT|nr:hypothetical protein [Aporhodopirellula rubra]MBB3206197.1 hypothetical protein [Aporhodopirellula rubra]
MTRNDFMGAHEWAFYVWKEGAGHKFYGPNNATDLWHVKKVSPQQFEHLPGKPAELAVMAMPYAELQIGEPYGLKNYFWRNSKPDGRTRCSEFVQDVLNSSGRYHLSYGQGFKPQTLLSTIGSEYSGPAVVSEPV